jgi:hypothetical protein
MQRAVACREDTLRNSGKYGIFGLDGTEMTATYSMGIGSLGQKRVNSLVPNSKRDNSLRDADPVRL